MLVKYWMLFRHNMLKRTVEIGGYSPWSIKGQNNECNQMSINIWIRQRGAPNNSFQSIVGWCTPPQHLQLCTLLSMSQRLRSLKITHWDRFRSQVVFPPPTPPSVFAIRCQQNFLGVQMTPFMSMISHGFPIQTSCNKAAKKCTQCLFVTSMQKAYVRIYLSAVVANNVIMAHNFIWVPYMSLHLCSTGRLLFNHWNSNP